MQHNLKYCSLIVLCLALISCTPYKSNSERFGPPSGSNVPTRNMSLKGQPRFLWPVKKINISRGFKPKKNGRKHYGLDLTGKKNTPILASHPGLVIYAGSGYTGYGKVVILEYNKSWATLYAHLNKFKVKEGQYVNAGDQVGAMGSTGRSTGVHLHFEIMKDKLPRDPLNYLKK